MKTKTLFIVLLSLSISTAAFSQAWVATFPATGLMTVGTNEVVGVGTFPVLGAVGARLHVNSFLCAPSSTGLPFGNVFRTDALSTAVSQWQMFTGATAATSVQRGRIYTTPAPGVATQPAFIGGPQPAFNHFLMESTLGDIVLRARGYNNFALFAPREVVRVTRTQTPPAPFIPGVVVDEGRVSISRTLPIVQPLAMLHIGDPLLVPFPWVAAVAGWRPWMDVGTYYCRGNDNMYTGLRELGGDLSNAYILWGNNPSSSPGNSDRMLFAFMGSPPFAVNGQSATLDGLETARMFVNVAPGGINTSRMGIGGDPNINTYSAGTFLIGTVPQSDPNNTLEVNSPAIAGGITPAGLPPNTNGGFNVLNGFPGAATGLSGLRLTDLTAGSVPVPTGTIGTTTNVLSLDANGDVILVPPPGGATLCLTAPAIPANAGINLGGFGGGFNFHFLGNFSGSALDNSVLIGSNCAFAPRGKLDVRQSSLAIGTTGIYVENTDAISFTRGVFSMVNGTSANFGQGVFRAGEFQAGTLDAKESYAVYAISNGFSAVQANFGVYGEALNGVRNIGIYGKAPITAIQTPGFPAVGNDFAGYFDGDVVRTGTDNFTSDANLKENIDSISDAVSIVMQLQTHEFNFKTNDYPSMSLPGGIQYGLIAQEVETLLPSLVKIVTHPAKYDTLGNLVYPEVTYRTLSYSQFIPFLIKTVQVQNARIAVLEGGGAKIGNSNLPSQIASLASGAILYQNAPNPFDDETSIAYYLPNEVVKAEMVFFDTYGREIKTVELVNRGDAKVDLTTSDLASGIYTYRLVADGTVVKTLQMVRTK